MNFVYVILLFTGYISMFASIVIFSADFPSEFMMKIILLMGLGGAVLVYRIQTKIEQKYRHQKFVSTADCPVHDGHLARQISLAS